MWHVKRKNGNFTLIELLVVIAIIALLAGMLLPSLNKARLKASSVDCLNQLHQINLLFLNYLQDSKDNYPTMTTAPVWGGKDGMGGVSAYGWTYLLALNASATGPDSYRKLFRCPREQQRQFSYSMNVRELQINGKDGGSALNYTAWHQTELAKAKTSPSRMVLVEESPGNLFNQNDCDQDNYSFSTTSADTQRHGNVNLLLADGHGEGIRFFDSTLFSYFTTEMSIWK